VPEQHEEIRCCSHIVRRPCRPDNIARRPGAKNAPASEATPATVAVGYYMGEANRALRIRVRRHHHVDTLLTSNPTGLGPRRRARRQDSGVVESGSSLKSPAIAAGPAATS